MSRIVWCSLLLMGMSSSFLGAEWTTEVIQTEDAALRTGTKMDTHFVVESGGILKVGTNYTIGGTDTEPRANLTLNVGGEISIAAGALLRTDQSGIHLQMYGGTITALLTSENGGLSLRGNDLVDIYGGTINVNRMNLAAGGRTSTMNLHDGQVSIQYFDFGYGGGTGNLNIYGGEMRILQTGAETSGIAEIAVTNGEMYVATLGGAKEFHLHQTGGTVVAGNVNLRGGG
ncbi:MAG: hypothetical protein Q4D62_00445 [Planctomycetia bacterium]|nr:hypothetical protein [Planctomycetia bacterium]